MNAHSMFLCGNSGKCGNALERQCVSLFPQEKRMWEMWERLGASQGFVPTVPTRKNACGNVGGVEVVSHSHCSHNSHIKKEHGKFFMVEVSR